MLRFVWVAFLMIGSLAVTGCGDPVATQSRSIERPTSMKLLPSVGDWPEIRLRPDGFAMALYRVVGIPPGRNQVLEGTWHYTDRGLSIALLRRVTHDARAVAPPNASVEEVEIRLELVGSFEVGYEGSSPGFYPTTTRWLARRIDPKLIVGPFGSR